MAAEASEPPGGLFKLGSPTKHVVCKCPCCSVWSCERFWRPSSGKCSPHRKMIGRIELGVTGGTGDVPQLPTCREANMLRIERSSAFIAQ